MFRRGSIVVITTKKIFLKVHILHLKIQDFKNVIIDSMNRRWQFFTPVKILYVFEWSFWFELKWPILTILTILTILSYQSVDFSSNRS